MTPEEQQLREIEQGEAWLHEVCPDPAGPDPDRLKQHVRLAIQEQWLRAQLHDEPPVELAERAKLRVRAALQMEGQYPRQPMTTVDARRSIRVLYRWAAGVGALAAALALAFVGFHRTVPAEAELFYVTAFESYTDGEFATTVATLDDELSDLELAYDDYAAVDTDSALFDELSDTVESLLTENGFDDDWS